MSDGKRSLGKPRALMNEKAVWRTTVLLVLAFVGAGPACSENHASGAGHEPFTSSRVWHHVTVGVEDLDKAVALWSGVMGLEVRERSEGPDPGLAELWGIDADDIHSQAMVGTPGARNGYIHLVQFIDPDPPVRKGAEVYDRLPKNLDVFVEDLPARFAELKAQGAQFRTDTYSEVRTPSGSMFREIHMHGHDATNIVFVETGNGDRAYSGNGYSAVTQLINIVGSAEEEQAFFVDVMGMALRSQNVLGGPEVEKMVGLPPGTSLDIRIVGEKGASFGMVEVVDYLGIEGADRYALARPKALGTLHVTYLVDDLELLKSKLEDDGKAFEAFARVETLFGTGPAIAFHAPSGLRIEAHERN